MNSLLNLYLRAYLAYSCSPSLRTFRCQKDGRQKNTNWCTPQLSRNKPQVYTSPVHTFQSLRVLFSFATMKRLHWGGEDERMMLLPLPSSVTAVFRASVGSIRWNVLIFHISGYLWLVLQSAQRACHGG